MPTYHPRKCPSTFLLPTNCMIINTTWYVPTSDFNLCCRSRFELLIPSFSAFLTSHISPLSQIPLLSVQYLIVFFWIPFGNQCHSNLINIIQRHGLIVFVPRLDPGSFWRMESPLRLDLAAPSSVTVLFFFFFGVGSHAP